MSKPDSEHFADILQNEASRLRRVADDLSPPAQRGAATHALELLRIEAPNKYLAEHRTAGGVAFADQMYADGMRAAFGLAIGVLAAPPAERGTVSDALQGVIRAYGAQEDGHSGVMDGAIAEAKNALAATAPFDDLEDLVARFSKALLAKLKLSRANGRSGWEQDDWEEQCQHGLLHHVEKGDPRDVAAYCAFMWHHGWATKAASQSPAEKVKEELPADFDIDEIIRAFGKATTPTEIMSHQRSDAMIKVRAFLLYLRDRSQPGNDSVAQLATDRAPEPDEGRDDAGSNPAAVASFAQQAALAALQDWYRQANQLNSAKLYEACMDLFPTPEPEAKPVIVAREDLVWVLEKAGCEVPEAAAESVLGAFNVSRKS